MQLVIFWRSYARTQEEGMGGGVEITPFGLDKFPLLLSLYNIHLDKFSIKHGGLYAYYFLSGQELFEAGLQIFNINQLCKKQTWSTLTLYNSVVGANYLTFGLCSLLPNRIMSLGKFLTLDIIFDLLIATVSFLFFEKGQVRESAE